VRGAAYASPAIHVAFGSPSHIAPRPDGRVAVTIGEGETARVEVYDQVIIAHGQDPAAPGGSGALLGARASSEGGDVPAGTIALKPSLTETGDLVGLESIDPPGIRLIGAAFANPKLAPWVKQEHREEFLAKVKGLASGKVMSHTFEHISPDSIGVHGGIEAQRDRIPVANEVLAAQAYRLPGPDGTLELTPGNEGQWDDQVEDFLAASMRADRQWVRVQRFTDGRSGALVFAVYNGGESVGILKVFPRAQEATNEQAVLQILAGAKLKHMTSVRERGLLGVEPESGFSGALLMDKAPGRSLKAMVEGLPEGQARADAFERVRAAVRRAAEGLAEFHNHFASGGEMTREAKLADANHFLDEKFRKPWMVEALGAENHQQIERALLEKALPAFLAAKVPATAYHGDANIGNFLVDKFNPDKGTFKDLSVIDVGSMRWSFDRPLGEPGAQAIKTGAADVARFLGSLESIAPGKLSEAEIGKLREAFENTYFKRVLVAKPEYEAAETWYRIEMELIAAVGGDKTAVKRSFRDLGIDGDPR